LNVLHQGIAMGGLASEGLENHHFQGAGKQIPRSIVVIFHKALTNHA
jgi:hypothetical protein